MDTRTGKLHEPQAVKSFKKRGLARKLKPGGAKFVVPLDEEPTPEQARLRRVSIHDHTTPAGKVLGRMRNLPCPCGSGRKLKQCCGKGHRG